MPTTAQEDNIKALHNSKNSDIAAHLEILFGDTNLGSAPFLQLYKKCIEKSHTPVPYSKWQRRAQRAYTLGKYYQKSLSVEGERIECGVYLGFSSLLLCELYKQSDPDFTGEKFHIVDSFEGLADPTINDAMEVVTNEDGTEAYKVTGGAGAFAVTLAQVQSNLSDFKDISYYEGWIPEVLAELPEKKWAFVHIDVDHYEPTLACLEYFYPRMSEGGIIVNDDYNSPRFPGGGKSWDHFCEKNNIPFVDIDTGQSVIIK